jgi:hypothetical protein
MIVAASCLALERRRQFLSGSNPWSAAKATRAGFGMKDKDKHESRYCFAARWAVEDIAQDILPHCCVRNSESSLRQRKGPEEE